MCKLFLKYRHLLWMLLFAATAFSYFLCEYLPRDRFLIYSRIDDIIPFVPAFIVPYIIWYIYVPLPVLIVGLKDKENFYYQIISLFSGVFICVITFVAFPSEINFRPDIAGNDIFSQLCRIIYSNDRPVNVFPSLHCLEAASVHFSTFVFGKFKNKKMLRGISAVFLVFIVLSTVFVKQHSVIDAAVGTALAVVIDIAVIKIINRRENSDNKSV